MMRSLIAVALAAVLAAPAAAHTAYLKPDRHWANTGGVNVQGAFTTTFFTPEIGLSSNFEIIGPDGAAGYFSQAEVTPQAALLRSPLHQYGTYRITSGEQRGAVSQLVGVDGAWRPAVAGEVLPEGALTTTLQTVTLAETYVTRGTPSRTAVDRVVGQLAIKPVTHPNQILINAPFQVQVLFDGAPLANTALVIYAAGDPETDIDRYVATDASGTATITLDQPGAYVLAARHRADAPAGSEAEVHSFTTTLTFEAMNAMPEFVAPPEEENRRGRRRR